MKVKAGLALAIVIVMGFMWASTRNVEVEYPAPDRSGETAGEPAKEVRASQDRGDLGRIFRETVEAIEEERWVRDAAITQSERDPDHFNVAIVMGYAASEKWAKEVGDRAMRMLKTALPGETPCRREIGRGRYDYLVGIYTPDKQTVAMGAKVASSPHITW